MTDKLVVDDPREQPWFIKAVELSKDYLDSLPEASRPSWARSSHKKEDTVKTYVKKRIPVQAMQFDKSSSWTALQEFTGGLIKNHPAKDDFDKETYYVFDYLHNTWVEFKVGDWIVRGVKGEFYPVEEEVFSETYEIFTDEATS